MNSLISSLINHGNTLAYLLREAKRKSNLNNRLEDSDDLQEKVKTTVIALLGVFNGTQGTMSMDADTYSANKVLQKIEESLQKFIQVDDKQPSKIYAELKNDVESLRRKFLIGTSSSKHLVIKSSLPSGFNSSLQEDSDFEDAYRDLTDVERRCLICLVRFSSSEEIKKRELIHWWIGMDLVNDQLEGDQVLNKLVDKEFIDSVTGNKRIYNRYKMHQIVMDKVEREIIDMVRFSWQYKRKLENDTISIIHGQQEDQDEIDPKRIEALLNIKRSNINTRTFEWISGMTNIKVLSIGNNGSDSNSKDSLIEIERVTKLKMALRRLKEVRCLSLQGISRIVDLPSRVYNLKKLKVLDLKACHDLMTVPKGIESLSSSLTHLDLSMCYMIDFIPIEVMYLRNLVVLKGFVINKDSRGLACSFEDLSLLENLEKLSIRTRRMDFPTKPDLKVLHDMAKLTSLRIAWVGKDEDISSQKDSLSDAVFPEKLTKLELQAAPAIRASQLLELMSKQVRLEKVHIKGGRLWDFGPGKALQFVHVNFLRLSYLPNLHINWPDFKTTFPKLNRLEITKCPNLIFFPCDQNGVWENLE